MNARKTACIKFIKRNNINICQMQLLHTTLFTYNSIESNFVKNKYTDQNIYDA